MTGSFTSKNKPVPGQDTAANGLPLRCFTDKFDCGGGEERYDHPLDPNDQRCRDGKEPVTFRAEVPCEPGGDKNGHRHSQGFGEEAKDGAAKHRRLISIGHIAICSAARNHVHSRITNSRSNERRHHPGEKRNPLFRLLSGGTVENLVGELESRIIFNRTVSDKPVASTWARLPDRPGQFLRVGAMWSPPSSPQTGHRSVLLARRIEGGGVTVATKMAISGMEEAVRLTGSNKPVENEKVFVWWDYPVFSVLTS